ncbi:active regulator of SIRT1-like [Portunus trituberculatus]|uniref:active regulator of SIRT1-like n=1 Tax=Portunus trituberculatus TaxID=210409 RepID=UPI001E1D1CF2|nr:active regulator of SIRT1-like [Portunus trituberculatus]XP_045124759.1 active regulator of SIRT1-like [Portunus trituberculatus]
MSWSLVKRGLELCEEDQTVASKSRKVDKLTPGKGSRHQKEKRAAKQRKIAKQKELEIKSLFNQKQGVSALDKYRQNTPKDRTTDNIKLLKKIDRKRTPQEYVEKILSQHSKELERRGGTKEAAQTQGKKKPEETTVFSDEDFEKMNKEWLKLY